MPPAVVKTLHDALRQAMLDPQHVAQLAKFDQELAYLGLDDSGRSMREIHAAEKRVVESLGLARGGLP